MELEGPLDEMLEEIKLRPSQFMSHEELLNFTDPRTLVRRWRPNLFCTATTPPPSPSAAATSSASTPPQSPSAATPPYQSPSDMAGWVSPSTYLQDCKPRDDGENSNQSPKFPNDIDMEEVGAIEISSDSDLDSFISKLENDEPDSPLPSDLVDIEPFRGEEEEDEKEKSTTTKSEDGEDECEKKYPSGLFVSPGKEAQPVLMDIDDDDESERGKVDSCYSSSTDDDDDDDDHVVEIDLISDGTVSPIIGEEIEVVCVPESPASPPPPPPPSPISSVEDEDEDHVQPSPPPYISNISIIRALFLDYLDTEGTCQDTVTLLRWYIYQTSGLLRVSLFYVLTQIDIIEWHIDFLDCAFYSMYMEDSNTWCQIYRLFHESYLGVPFGCGPLYVYAICSRSDHDDHHDEHDDHDHDHADQPPTKKFKRS